MTKISIIPRGKNVLVQRDDPKDRKSEHGIITPDNVDQEQKAYGTVIEVGPLIKDLKKGDHVIYGAYAGEDIEVDEKGKKVDYKLLDDEDIIAFITK
jgi:co-chaperonin GroES (HSP10)